MKVKRTLLILCVLLVIGTAGMIVLSNQANQRKIPQYPAISIMKLSAPKFDDALNLYYQNPIHNGVEKAIVMPDEAHLSYYEVRISDEGYSDTLPIEQKIYFATDENNQLVEDSSFTITAPKDLSSRQLQYLNTVIWVTNYGEDGNEMLITLWVNTVYNNSGSYAFDYQANVVVHLDNLDVVSYSKKNAPETE